MLTPDDRLCVAIMLPLVGNVLALLVIFWLRRREDRRW